MNSNRSYPSRTNAAQSREPAPRRVASSPRAIEPLLWVVLGLTAAALRLTGLGTAPLSAGEAVQALNAYQTAHGLGGVVQPTAPLLYHLNTFLFALFEGGDGWARVVPALFGVALALVPLLLRRYLGRWGALGTGVLLAVSPTAWLVSRTLDGAIPAALGVMLLVGCAARFLDEWRSRLVIVGGVGLAVALTAAPMAWGLLLGLLVVLLGALWVWRDQIVWGWPAVRPVFGKGLLATGLGVLLLGSGLFLNPRGLAASAAHLLEWAGRFGPPTGVQRASFIFLLLAYEPLILGAGVVGLVLALRRRHGLGLLLAFWALVGWIQLTLMPGSGPADLLLVLLPLAGLGGLAVEALVQELLLHGRWLNEGLYVPVSFVLWAHCGLTLARYSRSGDGADLVLAGLTVALQVLLTVAFGVAVSVPEPGEEAGAVMRRSLGAALRAGGLSVGLAALLATCSLGWGVTHVRPADARELLLREPTALETRTLVDVVEHVSVLNTGAKTGLPVTFLGEPDPALVWSLRHFDQRIIASSEDLSVAGAEHPPLVVAASTVVPPSGYFGEVFALRKTWTFPAARHEVVRWWLYRAPTQVPWTVEQVALWVREDLGTAGPRALIDQE